MVIQGCRLPHQVPRPVQRTIQLLNKLFKVQDEVHTYGLYCLSFPRLTLLSLLVNLSVAESVASNDVLDSGALLAQTAQPSSAPWALEHLLVSTDAIEAFPVSASSAASSSGPDQSSLNTQSPQDDGRPYSVDQFVTHRERIDDIRMGVHDPAASKARQRSLLAQMDAILTLFPARDLNSRLAHGNGDVL
jgi:hypothetical protein